MYSTQQHVTLPFHLVSVLFLWNDLTVLRCIVQYLHSTVQLKRDLNEIDTSRKQSTQCVYTPVTPLAGNMPHIYVHPSTTVALKAVPNYSVPFYSQANHF